MKSSLSYGIEFHNLVREPHINKQLQHIELKLRGRIILKFYKTKIIQALFFLKSELIPEVLRRKYFLFKNQHL